jgi:outer membrane receptor protein involved in Fe transport
MKSDSVYFFLVFIVVLLSSIQSTIIMADNRLDTIVVTATRNEQSLAGITINTDWVDEDSLKLIGHTHINESMYRLAGTWISRGNGQEHLTAIRSPVLTGGGGCGSFLMMQDGISLRAAGFCNVNELFEANTEQAGRIEVIKGPGSAVHGSNAMHGVVDVISPLIPPVPETLAGIEAGSFDFYRFKLSHSTASTRLDINGVTEGGYKDDSGYDQQKLNFQTVWNGQETKIQTRFSASNLNQETAGYVTGYKAYKEASLRKDNPNPEAFRDAHSFRLHSRIEYLPDDQTEIILTPYVRDTDMTFLQHFLPGHPLEENGQQSIGVLSSWHHSYNDRWAFIGGLDLEYTRAFLEEFQAEPTDSDSAFLRATIPAGKHYDYEVDATVASPFLQLLYQLTDDTRVTAGIRFDYVSYDYDNQMLNGRTRDDGTPCGFGGCRFSRPADRKDHFSNWSPKLGISHNFETNHQVYLSLAKGFRAPQATELYRLQNAQIVSKIDSEELDSIELGLRGSANRVTYDASVYAMTKDNIIFRDSNRVNVDNGKSSHEGLELTAAINLTDELELAVSATYAKHAYDFNRTLNGININGNDVDTAPRHMGSAQLNWRFIPGANAELEWIHMGKYYQDPENLNRYAGHDYVNLRVRASLPGRWILSLKLINLFDVDYAERADYGFGEDRYFVGNPFSVYLGIEGKF